MDTLTPYHLWLIASVVFFIAEALGVTGVGFLFAGFGAIVTGGALYLGWLEHDATLAQFSLFFAATAASALLLWKPLQKWRLGKANLQYHNIIGGIAYVGHSGLTRRDGGDVTWSGTIMKAQLAQGVQVDRLESGAKVVITQLSGATLIVKPHE